MAGVSRGGAAAGPPVGVGTLRPSPGPVGLLLRASRSMGGGAKTDGNPKQKAPGDGRKPGLHSATADREIGFMAYGHREKGSCEDIELIVPPQAGSTGAVSAAADSLKFIGK